MIIEFVRIILLFVIYIFSYNIKGNNCFKSSVADCKKKKKKIELGRFMKLRILKFVSFIIHFVLPTCSIST